MLSKADWEDIIAHVRINHPQLVRGWFAQLEPVALYGGVLRIHTGNPMQVRYLEDHCRLAFTEAAQATLGKLVTASFEAEDTTLTDEADAAALSFEGNGQLRLNDDYVFENFVVGPGNRLAHAAAIAVGESPGTTKFSNT